jgi:hypothetical protein
MTLRRFYPWFGVLGLGGLLLFALGLGVILFQGRESDLHGTIAWAVFAVGMAVLGGASWVVKTILEVGFHLQEVERETVGKGRSGSSPL